MQPGPIFDGPPLANTHGQLAPIPSQADLLSVYASLRIAVQQNLHGSYERTTTASATERYHGVATHEQISRALETVNEDIGVVYDFDKERWVLDGLSSTDSLALCTAYRKLIPIILSWFPAPGSGGLGLDTNVKVVSGDDHFNALLCRAGGFPHLPSVSLDSGDIILEAKRGPLLQSTCAISNILTCLMVRASGPSSPEGMEDIASHLGVYVRFLLQDQPARRHVDCLYLTESHVQLIHFDRGVVQYTRPINIHKDPWTFVRLLAGLGMSALDGQLLGLDPALQVPGALVIGQRVGKGFAFKWYQLAIPHPTYNVSTTIAGGITRTWQVYDQGTLCIVWDIWGVPSRGASQLDHEIQEMIVGVPGVVQLRARKVESSVTSIFRGRPRPGTPPIPNLSFTRTIFEAAGGYISQFTSELELLCAFRDAIAGHRALLNSNGLLHRNVTNCSILLGGANKRPGYRGVLCDFSNTIQMRKLLEGSRPHIQGTLCYQSISALEYLMDPDSKPIAHFPVDDLESFFYILFHIFSRWHGPMLQDLNPHSPANATVLNWQGPLNIARQSKLMLLFGFSDDHEILTLVTSFWSTASRSLLVSFYGFIRREARLRSGLIDDYRCPGERKNAMTEIWEKRNYHYDTVLSFFDAALESMGVLRPLPNNTRHAYSTPANAATAAPPRSDPRRQVSTAVQCPPKQRRRKPRVPMRARSI